MTSANVFYLDFRNRKTGETLHRHRQNAMCHEKYDWDKILSLPLDDVEILTWGYDEEDEYWESPDDESISLKKWLEQVRVTNKELREKLNEQK